MRRSTPFTLALILAGVGLAGCRKEKAPVPENTMSNVLHVTAGALPAIKSQTKPVLLDFWAPWCGPCRTQGPILDQVATRIGDAAVVGKVNVDEEKDLAREFGVQAIPTLVVLKEGRIVERFVGVQGADQLIQALEAHK